MKIAIHHACVDPDRMPFDTAERKGIGHPGSLADLVADTFSQRYSTWCLRQFGAIPNHWVDRVNLVGAAAEISFGGFDIANRLTAISSGRSPTRSGRHRSQSRRSLRQFLDQQLSGVVNVVGARTTAQDLVETVLGQARAGIDTMLGR